MCFSQNWLTQKNIITSKVNKLTRKIDDQSRKREYERKRMLNLLTNLETIRDIISRAESSVKNFISAVLTIGNTLLPPPSHNIQSTMELLPSNDSEIHIYERWNPPFNSPL
jgi:hypothetical protein